MGDAKLIATLGAAALEHIAPVSGAHALAKTVCLHFMPDIRLIRSFHGQFPLKILPLRFVQSQREADYSTLPLCLAILFGGKFA